MVESAATDKNDQARMKHTPSDATDVPQDLDVAPGSTPVKLGKTQSATDPTEVLSPLITDPKAAAAGAANSSVTVSHESYEERKMALAKSGQLIPALKQSSLKGTPYNRRDRKGNQIGLDRKKYHLTFIDHIEKKPLGQVHCVESYKKYNGEDPNQGDTPCCTIF